MKKISKKSIKAGVALFTIVMFLSTVIPVNASFQTSPFMFQQASFKNDVYTTENFDNESPLVCPSSALIYVVPPIIARITGVPYRLVRDWKNKQFPNTTIMFFGSLVSIRPRTGIVYSVISYSEDPPKKVELICDNKTYATLKGFSFPNLPITIYPFYYTKKGFHHLKFVPDGNESACLDIDFQVGFKGFLNNILPYLA
ncbi:MAG: hypothetical protein JSW60_04275 [Thermoplasmatales archaeon]|nr:MAG: hypothetical protein JSW60_04275 [Thermoplasmatales archaeon]